ncbi:MAG: preprotein translocase subunit SecA, partial [Nitrospirae bacterium]|nr:preprotein translocase subunit SecA [Nitrospirota bacterium]
MITTLIKKVIGTKNDRELKRIQPLIDKINALEPSISVLSDEQLKAKTAEFKKRLSAGETLDDILFEAFAVAREASKRVLNMRHFDVQLVGGIVLHEGKIAEMKTGEGKTLVATLPVYLNALSGKGVHVVTVNDYLAKRDSQWMGEIYRFLGFSVGIIQHDLNDAERQIAYRSDVTYGTNNEFGFDYLRDNMKFDISHYVQRDMNYAIVDEVDSILIDEARTPLIISGPTEESTDKYYKIDKIIPGLKKETDYTIEEKTRSVALTDIGNEKVEKMLGLSNMYDISNIEIVHHVVQALRAHTLFKKDVDYVVKDGEVLIVDEFTGRLMPGRRWSDGLHQAVEAKEDVEIANENQTLATITFQNYFRLYDKLAGMTGTADTEAAEFNKIYNLDVMVIPTNKDMIRADYADVVYKSEKEKFNAIVEEIAELHKNGQPVLVGTISIEKSERISDMLRKRGVKHSVLNAKYHEKEAEIVAQAGQKGTVTIATNMAGRGTDIVLGGNPDFLAKRVFEKDPEKPLDTAERQKVYDEIKNKCDKEKGEVIAAGGLHILGTERHEARRIDNQLRGRSGRQGDPGSSRFFLSLEDDLLRIFGSDRIARIMDRLGMEENVPIEHGMVTRAIENAQKKVETHNFEIRKHLLEYDDVMNKQREVIYDLRRQVLTGENPKEYLFEITEEIVDSLLSEHCSKEIHREEWDLNGLEDAVFRQFSLSLKEDGIKLEELNNDEEIREALLKNIKEYYEKKEKEFGSQIRQIEKAVMLHVIDTQWKDHLLGMDYLKEGIGLRGYGQKDPLVEYKKEGYEMFLDMTDRIKTETVDRLFKIQAVKEEGVRMQMPRPQRIHLSHGEGAAKSTPVQNKDKKVGRNDPCPCG